MGAHHPNPRLAKIHRNYSVEDTARLFNVHKNTVRNWLKDGLEPIDDQRPTLVRGEELRRFLNVPSRARSGSVVPAASTVCRAARRRCRPGTWPNALR